MAKPNFSFQKRQREQERERKKLEKAQRKLDRAADDAASPEGAMFDEYGRPMAIVPADYVDPDAVAEPTAEPPAEQDSADPE